jgi:glycosyltransferase involved in cell wall biosynthesis
MIGNKRESVLVDDRFQVSYFYPMDYLPFSEFEETYNLDKLWRLHSLYSGDRILQKKSSIYRRMLEEFKGRYPVVDVLIANWINPFHPEWLADNYPGAIKVYGCIDDPHAVYQRRVNSLWAFDGAFYISPSFDDRKSMPEMLAKWGIPHSHWWPLSQCKGDVRQDELVAQSWSKRNNGVLYIGNLYGAKLDRLARMKKSLGSDFNVYGKWPLYGFAGFLGPIKNRALFPYRVRTLTTQERTAVYMRSKIGFNMHLSDGRETGNLRMYEAPFHGLMLLNDKAANGAHEAIFHPGKEAVFYDSIEDAVEKAKYYLSHDSERERIARAGYERVRKDYDSDKLMVQAMQWASALRRRGTA